MRLLPVVLSALLLLGSRPAFALEKWFYVSTNLQVDQAADDLERLMERAAAAGYTHLLLADSKLARLGTLGDMIRRYTLNTERIKQAAARTKIEVVPALFHIGYSNAMLFHDPNLVEGPPVKEQPLVVEGGIARLADPVVPLPGGDFSDLKKWSWKDESVTAEDGTARVEANGGNARIAQKLRLQPWRSYHFSIRLKTQDLRGGVPEVKALAGGRTLNFADLGVKKTQDWTTHHVVFNTLENTDVSLLLGTWGASGGTFWWDDAKLEEIAFVNLIRREGCPLALTTEDGTALVEGRDFEPLRDPLLGAKPWPGEFDVFHEPPVLRVKRPDGTKLRASYYHSMTIYEGQAMVCPSEPKTLELLRDEARRVHALWGARGYMMSHDECRVMNWCAACQRRGLTPGQLLADNAAACVKILREVNPGGRICVWSDMFDPHHNAVKGPYYLVNGSLEGAWEGLEQDVVILPWYYEKRAESLKFFAGRGHRQIIAGYYDGPPGRIKDWLTAAQAVPDSVLGAMFTTWRRNYADLEAFSRAMDEVK